MCILNHTFWEIDLHRLLKSTNATIQIFIYMIGLEQFANKDVTALASNPVSPWHINFDGFYTPGYWVALAALARQRGVSFDELNISNGNHRGYCSAIGLPQALDGIDNYPYSRSGEGQTYSKLALLEHPNAVDTATQSINGCIRTLFRDTQCAKFVSDLCEVIGEVHDNVWSHGQSTGFSNAQKWPTGKFEFALADCGLGFKRELARVGRSMNDEESIAWCIQRGNSSKLINQREEDSWAQRLPPDMMGNPMPGTGRIVSSENHHQGLGLAKLVDLVGQYRGTLLLWSGQCMLKIDARGCQSYSATRTAWPGVALACRFNINSVITSIQSQEADDDITKQLLDLLGE